MISGAASGTSTNNFWLKKNVIIGALVSAGMVLLLSTSLKGMSNDRMELEKTLQGSVAPVMHSSKGGIDQVENKPVQGWCHCLPNDDDYRDRVEEKGLMCSTRSSLRGQGQKVISFSFYGSPSGGYFKGIEKNVMLLPSIYPGYLMRLHIDMDLVRRESSNIAAQLCKLQCDNLYFDICDVSQAIDVPIDLRKTFGMVWRFLPMADPLVDEWHSRDLDSFFTLREASAVQEWLNDGNRTIHIMRDHPHHRVHILGGMFGMRLSKPNSLGVQRNVDTIEHPTMLGVMKRTTLVLRSLQHTYRNMFILDPDNEEAHLREMMKEILVKILNGAEGGHEKGLDQTLLSKYLWPLVPKVGAMVHDSYLCQVGVFRSSGALDMSFPTRREDNGKPDNFVGSNGGSISLKEQGPCPEACRPADHMDWLLC